MRLINVATGLLEEFLGPQTPKYAILSHRWTDHEVSFADIKEHPESARPFKFQGALRQAREDDLKYLWIDTCCINKDSSAELTEAINSMFDWYRESACCYVYLHDYEVWALGHTQASSISGCE